MSLEKEDLRAIADLLAERQPKGFFEENKKAIIGAAIGLAVMWGATQRDLVFANETREDTQQQRITQERILTEVQQIKERLAAFESELRERTASRYTRDDAQRDLELQAKERILIWEAINKNAAGLSDFVAGRKPD